MASEALRVVVLGGFGLLRGNARIQLSEGSQRVLAFLALRPRPVRRMLVAASLWPNANQKRADACLRAALTRLHVEGREAIYLDSGELCLVSSVTVDIRESRALVRRLLDSRRSPAEADLTAEAADSLSIDLLPDWYDEWVILDVEEWRQLRLHALEALVSHLITRGRVADAVAAALAAVRADPLRESAHTALIQSHLAECNQAEAWRAFDRYRDLLDAQLGLQPTTQLAALLPTRRQTG